MIAKEIQNMYVGNTLGSRTEGAELLQLPVKSMRNGDTQHLRGSGPERGAVVLKFTSEWR